MMEELQTCAMESIRENGESLEQNTSKDTSNSQNQNGLLGLNQFLDCQQHILNLAEALESRLENIVEKKTLNYLDLLNLAIFGKIDISRKTNNRDVSFLLSEEEVKGLETTCWTQSVYLTTQTIRILSNALQTSITHRTFDTITDFLSTWASMNPNECGIPKFTCFTERRAPAKLTRRGN